MYLSNGDTGNKNTQKLSKNLSYTLIKSRAVNVAQLDNVLENVLYECFKSSNRCLVVNNQQMNNSLIYEQKSMCLKVGEVSFDRLFSNGIFL